jgi:uncharacterized protein YdcH (DUF465 family)
MAADAQDLQDDKASLLRDDGEFRQLVLAHHTLDERINDLSHLSHLTEQQHLEEMALKKQKLALKDRIEAILRSHRSGVPAPASSH